MSNRKSQAKIDLVDLYNKTYSLALVFRNFDIPKSMSSSSEVQQLTSYLSMLNTRKVQVNKQVQLINKWAKRVTKDHKNDYSQEEMQ